MCCVCLFWEHNLRLKPTKCESFWDEINYFAHHVSNEGMWPSKENLNAVVDFHSTPNLHGNLSLSWPDGAISVIHQGVCMYCRTLT